MIDIDLDWLTDQPNERTNGVYVCKEESKSWTQDFKN